MPTETSSMMAPVEKNVPFDEQVRLTFGFVREALAVAGCTLDDVVDCQCWLSDARDFVRFNEIYQTYFTKDPPVRSVFPAKFMFDVKVEIKVIAYRPVVGRLTMRAEVHQIVTFASEPFRGNPAFVLSIDQAGRRPTAAAGRRATWRAGAVDAFDRSGGDAPNSFSTRPRDATAAPATPWPRRRMSLLARDGDASAVLVLADGSERVVAREGNRISVPWPAMPSARVDMAGTLGAALGIGVRKPGCRNSVMSRLSTTPRASLRIRPDLDAITRLDRGTVIVTAPATESDLVIRVFAPKLGLPEDPVCGTAHRIIVPYWAERLNRTELHSRQLSPRGGDLWCRLEGDQVVISGESCTFLTGSVELPES